ncbi:MAG: hypothetical protein ACKOE8_13745 [Opitutaceae bacterium]
MIRLPHHFRRTASVLATAAALFVVGGCGKSDPKDAELRRKQAEHLLAEADFAVNLREWTRAEGLLLKATEVAPDEAEIWVSLGAARVLRGDKAQARTAYEKALSLHAGAASEKSGSPAEPWLRQVHILALLGREKDARVLLEKAGRRLDGNREVKAFIDARELDRLLADPAFAKVRL